MRTQKEILDRIVLETRGNPVFGMTEMDLISRLNFETAKQFLKPEVTKSDWYEAKESQTDEYIREEMKNYLSFAFEKAHGQRGISASRSIDHFRNWLWLLGDIELLTYLDDPENYSMYGLPMLRKIKQKYYPHFKIEGENND